LSVGDEGAWLLLALWVAQRKGADGDPATAALLALHTMTIDPALRRRAWPVFDRLLGGYSSGNRQPSNRERLDVSTRLVSVLPGTRQAG
jgi:hypothetical protein